jgi:hypothetical protein
MFKFISAAALVVAFALPAQAGTRLFGDSVLNLSDGFSDEITGNGPALVFLAGAQSPDELRDTVKALRNSSRIHLIRMTGPASPALQAYLQKYHLQAAAPGSAPLPSLTAGN